MKICPKCNTHHTKAGVFCCRKCANSREWNDEDKLKKSLSLKNKPRSKKFDVDNWAEKVKRTRLIKYNNTPFEKLGKPNKRRRVFEEQNFCCARCGISEWLSHPISLELEHIDGNNQNDDRINLEALCPNCHSLTDTWRGRNKPIKNGDNVISDSDLLKLLLESKSIRQGLLKAGISAKGNNYKRAKKLLDIYI